MVLVTGAAGFIGFHLCQRLTSEGFSVCGTDNMNGYYDPQIKRGRLEVLSRNPNFHFHELDLNDDAFAKLILAVRPRYIIHLAAQAGVRYSLENPASYLDSNLSGFVRLLETIRYVVPEHFIYASSSSVYGASTRVPYSTADKADRPVSLYAATKRANELLAHSYSHLFRIPSTGLRFFTVYGSWGRPDMAYWTFTDSLFQGREIHINNHGHLRRDFTHVSDIVESIFRILNMPPGEDPESQAPYRVLNIGASAPVDLDVFISLLEKHTKRTAKRSYRGMQPGDVLQTFADVSELESITGYTPRVKLDEGLEEFVHWYRLNIDIETGKFVGKG